jgi:hypothetical protein
MRTTYYVVLLMAGIENRIKCNTIEDATKLFNTLASDDYMVEMILIHS